MFQSVGSQCWSLMEDFGGNGEFDGDVYNFEIELQSLIDFEDVEQSGSCWIRFESLIGET